MVLVGQALKDLTEVPAPHTDLRLDHKLKGHTDTCYGVQQARKGCLNRTWGGNCKVFAIFLTTFSRGKLSRALLCTGVASKKGWVWGQNAVDYLAFMLHCLSLPNLFYLPAQFFRKTFRKSAKRRLAGTKLEKKQTLRGLFPLLLRPQRITWPKKSSC